MDKDDIFSIKDNEGKKKEMPFEKKYLIGVTIVAVLLIIIMTFVGIYIGYFAAGKSSHSIVETNPTINITGTGANGSLTVQDVSKQVENSVVQITSESRNGSSRGSGVIISKDGYVITNAHVVSNATSASSIKVALANGNEYTALDFKADVITDIAVVKINPPKTETITPAVIGNSSELNKGQPVVVIGNPLGTLGGSVTDGVLSALDRDIIVDNRPMRLLQTNAQINPGNSGGGMFDMHTKLIGIVNAKSSSVEVEGIGFAIPINDAYAVAKDLIKYGYVRGRIDTGIYPVNVQNMFDMLTLFSGLNVNYNIVYSGPGVYVRNVAPTYADDIRCGDKIRAINDQVIGSLVDYNIIIDKLSVGDEIKYTIERENKLVEVLVKAEEYKG